MPGRNGTGPNGIGARVGRGLGLCNHTNEAATFVRGGFGCGNGFGRNVSLRHENSETQKDFLREQKAILENRLKTINEQLESQ